MNYVIGALQWKLLRAPYALIRLWQVVQELDKIHV